MENKLWFYLCFMLLYFLDYGQSIKWLSLQHSQLQWNLSSLNHNPGRGIRSGIRSPCAVARRRYGFAKIQAKLCRNSMESMPHVKTAAIIAGETCQSIFQNRRWNCSSIKTAPSLTPDLTRATREQAYVYAISSAALAYTMARACASGALYHCTCAGKPSDPPNGNFQWGGCGDNLKWGTHFAKRFIDNVEKYTMKKAKDKLKRDSTTTTYEDNRTDKILRNQVAAVNLHNNRVGRRVVAESLYVQCKCHGVSGSCNIKTCWRALPSMTEIGQRLLRRYTTAKEVPKHFIDIANIPDVPGKRTPTSDQLVYISKSPDYCTKDDRLGSYGTVGRKCNVTSSGTDSCRQLCCGRGYRTVVEEKIERCQCKYYYCCYVKCKICRTMTQTHECS